MDKIKYIQQIMPSINELLVRTNGINEWFVHYFINHGEKRGTTIYKTYTDNLDKSLDEIIEIIKNNAKSEK